MKVIKYISLFILIMCFLIIGYLEAPPGHGSILTELSGDWSIKVGNSDYDIGRSIEYPKQYDIYNWKISGGRKERTQNTVYGVSLYSYDQNWILAKMGNTWSIIDNSVTYDDNDFFESSGWLWINTESNEIKYALTSEEFETNAPAAVKALKSNLVKPTKSYRNLCYELSLILAIIAVIHLLKEWFNKPSEENVIYNKKLIAVEG